MALPVFSNAQKLTASKVPAAVIIGLNRTHPGVSATWEREDADYEANFKEGNNAVSVIINSQGTILETETDIPVSELPKEAVLYLKTHYKGHAVKEASKIVKKNGEVNYEAMVKDRDVMFDVNGKYLKEIKEAKD